MEAVDEPYMRTPLLMMVRKRAGWLVVLFLGEMLTASAMSYYEGEIAKAVVLALFLPLIISSGSNSGSQASMLIIRAMALGEVTLRDWFQVMRKEIISGLMLGAVLGIIGFARVAIWAQFSTIYGPHWLLVAWTVSLSLVMVVLWGSLIGFYVYAILFPAWWSLSKIGLTAEPDHWIIYGVALLTATAAYFYRKWQSR